jgi:hypothetical protein
MRRSGQLRNSELRYEPLGAENKEGFDPKHEMSPEIFIRASDMGQRYETLLRISEALSACREPEDLTSILSNHLREFLHFFHFYIIVYKENSTEVEWAVVGPRRASSVRTPMCQSKTGRHGGHTLHRNLSTSPVGTKMKWFRRVLSMGLQPKVFTSDRWFLWRSRHRIGAWARWVCPDLLAPLTVPKTFLS